MSINCVIIYLLFGMGMIASLLLVMFLSIMKEFAFQMWKLKPPPIVGKLKIRIPDSRQGSITFFIVSRWTL